MNRVRTGIEAKFYNLSLEITKELGFELYDMEYIAHTSTLRVYIMDTETGTAIIEDCVAVDRAFTPYCEEEGSWIPEEFLLEVSSPGVYRNLKKIEHFQSAVDEIISCAIAGNLTSEQIEILGKKEKNTKKFRGLLKEIKEEKIVLDINDKDLELSFLQIKRANLDPDLNN